METHYKNFLTTFYKFVYDINRYVPSTSTQKALEVFNSLDIAKLIFRTYHLLKDNSAKLNNKDETLFQQSFIILPDVDVAVVWPKLIKGQKDKVWTYLNILQIESEFLMNPQQTTQISEPVTVVSVPEEKKPLEFNPYVGIGETNNKEYGVTEMYSALPAMEDDKPSGPGIEAIANMIGINKLINIEELTNQLKNMKKEDIESATNSIKGLLGNNVDEKTSDLITSMLTNISDEMKNSEMGEGDPLKKILSIAESVAGKMKPQIEKDNIDVSQLINSTQIFASQCKDKNGKPMFGDKMNPFALLGQFAGGAGQGDGTINEEAYAKQCNDMLKTMGINNVDVNNMDMAAMLAQLQGQKPKTNTSNSNKSGKSGKSVKNNKNGNKSGKRKKKN